MPLHQTVSNASLCNFQLHSHALYSVLHSDRFTNWRKRFWKAEQEERERKRTTKDTVGEDSGVRAELLRISPEQEEHTNDPAGRSSQHWREHWRELQAGSFNALRAAKEVVAQAKAAGLTLEQGESASGYKGVYKTAAAATFTARAAPTQRARPVRLQLGIWQGRVYAAAHTRHACPAPGCFHVSKKRREFDQHLRSHTGEKPYFCPIPGCNFSSSLARGLKSHIKEHCDGDQPSVPTLTLPTSTGDTDQNEAGTFDPSNSLISSLLISESRLPTAAVVQLQSYARVTPILRKLKLHPGGQRRPSHPVVFLKLSVCSDSGLVRALAEVTLCKASTIVALVENDQPLQPKLKKFKADKPPRANKKEENDDEPTELLPWAVPDGLAVSAKPNEAAMVPRDPESKKLVGRSEAGAKWGPRRSYAVPLLMAQRAPLHASRRD